MIILSNSSGCEIEVEKVAKPIVKPEPTLSSFVYDSPVPPKVRRRSFRQRVTSVVATKFKDSTPTTRSASKKILQELKDKDSTLSCIVDSYDANIACSQEVRDTLIAIHKD